MTIKPKNDWEKELPELRNDLEEAGYDPDEVIEIITYSERQRLRDVINNWEIDKEAHIQGKCSFRVLALCSAEEQRIKMELLKLLE